jgi:Tfp pilus assembly protein PilF
VLKALLARLRAPAAAADTALRLRQAQAMELAGKPDAAAEIYRQVLVSEPAQMDALLRSARLEGMRGNLPLARRRLEAALLRDPGLAAAHADLGNVLQLSGDTQGARHAYETALAIEPARAVTWNNLGLTLLKAGELEAAADAFAAALHHAPLFGEALRNLVSVSAKLERHGEMRDLLQAMLAEHPHNADAHAALGFVELLGFARPAVALQHFDAAMAQGLDGAELLTNRGIALHDLGRIEAAIASYDAALRADPQHGLARFHRSLARLITHRFELAWDDYEARPPLAGIAAREPPLPRWQGGDLHGKRLLILAEQGLGDEIMFASCFPEVIARAEHCIIDCAAKLEPLFRRSFPQASVHGGSQFDGIDWLRMTPPADAWIAAGSLPRLLRAELAAFPERRAYLFADAAAAAHWRSQLDALGPGAKIGVSWRGGTAHTRSGMRSLQLAQLAPVFAVPGAHFVSLQFDAEAEEVAAFSASSGVPLTYFSAAMADYDQTAALVSSLDLVISVCTAVIHLGGALGTPVWVMAPKVPEWRYGLEGEAMPWYPGNRVLRQSEAGDWAGLIERVAARLADKLRA